jgi:hypothetical protein
MNGGCLEGGRLAGEQRVSAAGVAEQNAPAEPKFAAARVGAYLAACGGDGHLQTPAAAEERYAGGEDGLGEFDLAGDGVAAVVDVERGPRHGDAVVALEGNSRRERGAVGGGEDVDLQGGVDAV